MYGSSARKIIVYSINQNRIHCQIVRAKTNHLNTFFSWSLQNQLEALIGARRRDTLVSPEQTYNESKQYVAMPSEWGKATTRRDVEFIYLLH